MHNLSGAKYSFSPVAQYVQEIDLLVSQNKNAIVGKVII